MEEIEHFFNCPYCGKNISMLVDTSVSPQQYIEDCEVCCCPIVLEFSIENQNIKLWKAFRTDA